MCSQQNWGGKEYHSPSLFFSFFFSFYLKDSFVPPPVTGLEKVTKDQGGKKRLVTSVFSAWQAVATQAFTDWEKQIPALFLQPNGFIMTILVLPLGSRVNWE